MAKRIDNLTPQQEARFGEWCDKWINIGLRTGETDWATFEKYMPVAYEKANLKYPTRIVRVNSPLIGALAASIAENILRKGDKNRGAVGGAVGDAVGGAVRGAVDDAVGGAVRDAVGDAVDDAVGGAVGGAVRGAVAGAVGGAVDDAVGGAVRDAVGDAVDDAVRGAVDDAVRGAVRDAVGGAVDDAVGGAVDDAVGGAVDDAVGGAVGEWHYWLGGQFWVGGWWYGSPAMISFFREVCNLELEKDIEERADAYQKICESVNYIWPNSDFVMVCARPTNISRDEQGRLHSEVGMAIQYPDGWGLYMLAGVKFEEDLWKKVVSGKMTFSEILVIENTEQRLQAMRFNPNALLSESPKLINKSKRDNELYCIENSQVNKIYNEPKVWLLRFRDPSKLAPNNWMIEEVDPELAKASPDADVIQAYHLGLNYQEYKQLSIET